MSDPEYNRQDSRAEALAALERRLGYVFRERALLEQALTHGSVSTDKTTNNERMEFFGDAVLDFIICEELFRGFPERGEGELTEIKGDIVSRRCLAQAARRLQPDEALHLGKGITHHTKAGKELPTSIYANVFEALIAAVYLDGGLLATREVALRWLEPEIAHSLDYARGHNSKSLLQEWSQSEKAGTLDYRLLAEDGPEHACIFTMGVYLNDELVGEGTGRCKKEAERIAARNALDRLAPDFLHET